MRDILIDLFEELQASHTQREAQLWLHGIVEICGDEELTETETRRVLAQSFTYRPAKVSAKRFRVLVGNALEEFWNVSYYLSGRPQARKHAKRSLQRSWANAS